MEKTHWKRLVNPEYIGVYSLDDGKDLTVEIVKVEVKSVIGDGGKREDCTVATLKGQKPFIINRTNAKTITKLYGSPYIEDWEGKQIILYASTTRVSGEIVECLRIRQTLPKAKKEIEQAVKEIQSVKNRDELNALWEKHTALQKEPEFIAAVRSAGLKYTNK